MIRTIEWTDAGVVMLDQRLLPTQEIYRTYTNHSEVAEAIRSMVVRGAPAALSNWMRCLNASALTLRPRVRRR